MITTPDPAMSGQMKLVPVEPTPEMIRVGFVLALGTDDEQPSIAEVWRAMVEVAPVEASPTPVDDWRPIESAPKDGRHFWAYQHRREERQFECWWHDGHSRPYSIECWMDVGDAEPDPTHWQPLPAPPCTLASDLATQPKSPGDA